MPLRPPIVGDVFLVSDHTPIPFSVTTGRFIPLDRVGNLVTEAARSEEAHAVMEPTVSRLPYHLCCTVSTVPCILISSIGSALHNN
jgi:hypothetical protein